MHLKGFIIFLAFTMTFRLTLSSAAEESVPGVAFQWDGVPSNVSYIRWLGAVPDMEAVTVCTHLNIAHSRGRLLPLVSYATETDPNELSLYLDVQDGILQMLCCSRKGKYSSKTLFSSAPVFRWIHVCVNMNLRTKEYNIFIEDQEFHDTIEAQNDTELAVAGGGVFILGQGQGFLSQELDVHQSFQGALAGYFLTFSEFPRSLIETFLSCGMDEMKTPAVTLQDTKLWNVNGNSQLKTFSAAKICQPVGPIFVVFPVNFGFDAAISTCRKLGGEVVVPENDAENLKLLNTIQKEFPMCSRSDANAIAWIGANRVKEDRSGAYQNIMTQKILTYNKIQYDTYDSEQGNDCLFLESSPKGYWSQKTCRTRACVACSFKNKITYRLRGLSDDSEIDRQYVIHGTYNGRPVFNGLTGTIIRATANSTWELVSSLDPFIKGHLVSVGQITPVGRQTWVIPVGNQGGTVERELLLTACSSDQYTCRDGYCIDRKLRCDLEAHCPDQSDEEICLIIKLPKGYYTNVPPPKTSSNAVSVDISVEILSMQPLDRLNMNLEFAAKITLEWLDPRLLMRSLNDNSITNVILRPDGFWKPALAMEDEYFSEVSAETVWSFFTVIKQSDPLPDDDTIIDEDPFFLGSKSPLRLEEIFKMKMFCFLVLEGYPFDTQTCTFTIRMMSTPKYLLAFNYSTSSVVYNGPISIGEYSFEDIQILKNDLGNYSGQSIKMKLKNLSAYHVTVSYIPTVIMGAICYSTFFYNLDDFNDRIMVSLTSLLVLTTLFTQITVNTPKTAYLQLLDVWFVSSILYAFFVILLLVLINFVKINESQQEFTEVHKFNMYENSDRKDLQETQRSSIKINTLARRAMPIVGILFIAGYFTAAYTLF